MSPPIKDGLLGRANHPFCDAGLREVIGLQLKGRAARLTGRANVAEAARHMYGRERIAKMVQHQREREKNSVRLCPLLAQSGHAERRNQCRYWG